MQAEIEEIMALKGFKSKKEVVDTALEEYLKPMRQMEVLKWKGTDFWEGNLDEIRRD